MRTKYRFCGYCEELTDQSSGVCDQCSFDNKTFLESVIATLVMFFVGVFYILWLFVPKSKPWKNTNTSYD